MKPGWRTPDHGLFADVDERRAPDTQFYRLVTFASAVLSGVALAALWDHQVADPVAMAIQRAVAGSTTPAEVAAAFILAFVAGASMIVTA